VNIVLCSNCSKGG